MRGLHGAHLRTHGLSNTPEHDAWSSMMTRCYWATPGSPDFNLYKNNGVTVCDRWHDFRNFLADMGPKPSRAHTLDRIDSRGNYEPGNVRWATRREQARNRKSNRVIEFNGERLLLIEWAERIGITDASLSERIANGWGIEKALTLPPIRTLRKTGNRFSSQH